MRFDIDHGVRQLRAGFVPVGEVVRMLSGPASAAGDPKRAGEILVRVIKQDILPSHLILGAGAVQLAQDYSRSQLAEAAAWEPISRSADFDQDYPVDLFNAAEWPVMARKTSSRVR